MPDIPAEVVGHDDQPIAVTPKQRVVEEKALPMADLEGHAWIPLHIPPNLPSAEIVPAVLDQVRNIEDIAITAVSGAPTSGGKSAEEAAET